ncbi:hypothetical protein E2C06_11375 [Dankookia rubra]|uniref:Fungal lipase-like domain-containing protein n=1 Tax=Dankookia rubra TaxID=1442381 RepID=A0A4R5QGN0_9PROT|nr:hypothetical protein [Dankookia rubra]TDH62464.1 hypothetical protein E2C06_11375 [Dankookia rubra]
MRHDQVAEWSGMREGHGPHHARHPGCDRGHHGPHGPGAGEDTPGPGLPEASPPPDTATLLNAANWTYDRDLANLPAGLRFLEAGGQPLALEVTADGFYGAAFLTAANQLVLAFEGTHISALSSDPEFVAAQVLADGLIFAGIVPPAFGDAVRFAEAALAAAAALGIPDTAVYLTGHSLGGGEAAFVAAQLDLPGETYGAPGLPPGSIPAGASSLLTNYVEYGDPVGNYSAEPDVLNGFVQSPGILRFGPPSYLGNPLEGLALQAAGALFGPDSTAEENAAGLAALGALARQYHVLTTYAADLGVKLQAPGEPLSDFPFA